MAISVAAKSNHDQLFGAWPACSTTCTRSMTSSPRQGSSCLCPGSRRPRRRRASNTAHFQRYLAVNCFGNTVGRGGIDLEVRALLTFSMLVALGGADAQVRGHVNGNLGLGNTRARLLAVLTVLVPFIGYPRTLNRLAVLNDVTGS